MADFSNMYKFAALVHEESVINDDLVMGISDDAKIIRFPKEPDILKKFMERTDMNRYNAERIEEVTIQHDFVERIPPPLMNQDARLMLTYGKGHDFLYTVRGKRVGYYNEVFKHYAPYAVIISILALIISVIALVKK